MAYTNHGERLSLKAASAIAQNVPVMFLPGGSALDLTVQRAGSINDIAVGMTIATVATYGDPAAVIVSGEAKGIAGASLGAGALVGVGSTNGILIPLIASNIASVADGSGLRFVVGRALVNAAAADVFTIQIKAEQLV